MFRTAGFVPVAVVASGCMSPHTVGSGKHDVKENLNTITRDHLQLPVEVEAQTIDFRLDKERKEAERKEIEARGIQKFQQIVKEGIDDRLLRWKGIEATETLAKSDNTKVIVIGGGKDGLPLILGNP